MREKKTIGGIIAAAGKTKDARDPNPLVKMGSITVVKRIVLIFQQVNISPIVVITGDKAEEIEHDLADYGVIFLRNNEYESSRKFDSAKIGLEFIQNKCDQVIFTPVTTSMFTPQTLQKMMECGKKLILPSYHGKSGHPLLISCELIPAIMEYGGDMGLQGAIQTLGIEKYRLDVEDAGILRDMDNAHRLNQLIKNHNQQILHPFVRVSIENESLFFNSRTKLLLILIQDTHSVRSACRHIALSYSKAWNMINQLEQELGYAVVERKHGGSNGGKTYLTRKGVQFLEKFEQFEEKVRQYAKNEFNRCFI